MLEKVDDSTGTANCVSLPAAGDAPMKMLVSTFLLLIAQATDASAAEVKLKCVATNGFVRPVSFDESTSIIKLDDNVVPGTIGKIDITIHRKFANGSIFVYKIDRATGGMKVWNLDTGKFDSDYKCEAAPTNQF